MLKPLPGVDEAVDGVAAGLLAALVVPPGEFDVMAETEMGEELPLEECIAFQGLVVPPHLPLHPPLLHRWTSTSPSLTETDHTSTFYWADWIHLRESCSSYSIDIELMSSNLLSFQPA